MRLEETRVWKRLFALVKNLPPGVRSSRATKHKGTRYIEKFKTKKWHTHGAFAFSAGFATSEPSEEVFNTKVLVPILGSAEHEDAPLVRRLWYESFTAVASDMRQRCERTSDTAPLQVTQPERVARRERCQASVGAGMPLVGELEIGDSLLDFCADMVARNILKHIAWGRCVAKYQEIDGVTLDKQWVPDAQGYMKQTFVSNGPSADMSSDLRLHFLRRRRGLALKKQASSPTRATTSGSPG